MILTAIDTNVISALWSKEPDHAELAEKLDSSLQEGRLLLSAPAFSELVAYPGSTEQRVRHFADLMKIELDFDLTEPIWVRAGNAYAAYSIRRRRSGGGEPKRLLSDFVIGAHASLTADRLISRDVSRYRVDFPELEVI